MKVELWAIGKTDIDYLKEGISVYEKRLKHYTTFEIVVLSDVKNPPVSSEQLKIKEGDMILAKLQKDDFLVVMDEAGKQFTSTEFAAFLEKKQVESTKKMVFLIGGAFGFSEAIYARANYKMAFSKMTFTHQMIRLIFVEQLYRAFTIIKGEKYHN
jgi:23S rRNA (pseudouridine1915-N3)-methyltransferase